jgi:type II secretory pathway component PulJ
MNEKLSQIRVFALMSLLVALTVFSLVGIFSVRVSQQNYFGANNHHKAEEKISRAANQFSDSSLPVTLDDGHDTDA